MKNKVTKATVIFNTDKEYFPDKPIWLVFDQSNGDKSKCRYVWWFDTKEDADEWIKNYLETKSKYAYNVSKPTQWKPFK